jgi:hypothetical protein
MLAALANFAATLDRYPFGCSSHELLHWDVRWTPASERLAVRRHWFEVARLPYFLKRRLAKTSVDSRARLNS